MGGCHPAAGATVGCYRDQKTIPPKVRHRHEHTHTHAWDGARTQIPGQVHHVRCTQVILYNPSGLDARPAHLLMMMFQLAKREVFGNEGHKKGAAAALLGNVYKNSNRGGALFPLTLYVIALSHDNPLGISILRPVNLLDFRNSATYNATALQRSKSLEAVHHCIISSLNAQRSKFNLSQPSTFNLQPSSTTFNLSTLER